MALQELSAERVDDTENGSKGAVFVRCFRREQEDLKPTSKQNKNKDVEDLVVELYDAPGVWRVCIAPGDKPEVLDCSGAEYLSALETAFSLSERDSETGVRFTCKWSSKQAVLTLMEQATGAGFAMKYTALTLSRMSEQAGQWRELLHLVVQEQQDSRVAAQQQNERIRSLERMLEAKNAVLEKALQAKQHVEDAWFAQFCAVLNAKKDQIERLQHEVVVAQVRAESVEESASRSKNKSTPRKQAAPKAVKKPGAKLRKCQPKQNSEAEDSNAESGSEAESERSRDDRDEEEDDGDGDDSRRLSRDAVDAYSKLPAARKMRVCTADDVLNDLDAIMDHEVKEDEKVQEGLIEAPNIQQQSVDKKRSRGIAASSNNASRESGAGSNKKPKIEKETAKKQETPKRKSVKAPKAAPPPAAVDSEEEDILDMLA